MALRRLDNVGIVVEDLDAAVAFFEDLGMELEGRATVEGPSVDRLLALEGVRSEVVSLRGPGGQAGVELSRFLSPTAKPSSPAPVNTLGIGRIMFLVEDMKAVIERLQRRGAELHGEVIEYEDSHRLCYLRGPEGIMIALAEELRSRS